MKFISSSIVDSMKYDDCKELWGWGHLFFGYVSGEKSTPKQITFTVANENHYTKTFAFLLICFGVCVCLWGCLGDRLVMYPRLGSNL